MKRKVLGCLLALLILLAAGSNSGCGPSSGPEAIAIAHARAIYEEHDARRAASLACPESRLRDPSEYITGLAVPIDVSMGWEVKEFSVLKRPPAFFPFLPGTVAWPVTPADKANGISDRRLVSVHFLVRENGQTNWEDRFHIVKLAKRNGNWCVEDLWW